MRKICVFLSTCFGIGYFPKAPGTIGTLFAGCVYFILPDAFVYSKIYFPIFLLFGSLISVFIASEAEKSLGHDNGKIIIDEFFGYLIAVAALPKTAFFLITSFILFRFFDIVKPLGINKIQKLPKGWGIMADDVLAGLFVSSIFQVGFIIYRLLT